MAAARVLAFQDTGEPDIDANTVRLVNGERMSSTNGTGATRMVRLHALCMVMRTDARPLDVRVTVKVYALDIHTSAAVGVARLC